MGSQQPVKCDATDICPSGSSTVIRMAPFIVMIVLIVVAGLLWVWYHECRRRARASTDEEILVRTSSSSEAPEEEESKDTFTPWFRLRDSVTQFTSKRNSVQAQGGTVAELPQAYRPPNPVVESGLQETLPSPSEVLQKA